MKKYEKVSKLDEIYKYRKIFNDREFMGRVLTNTSILEEILSDALTQYFIRDDKYSEGFRLISWLSFDKKIQVFEHLSIRKQENFRRAVLGLRIFQKTRNMVAHSSLVTTADVAKLFKDSKIKMLMSNYPRGMDELFCNTELSLLRLIKTKTFHNKNAEKQFLDSDFEWDRNAEIHSYVFGGDE